MFDWDGEHRSWRRILQLRGVETRCFVIARRFGDRRVNLRFGDGGRIGAIAISGLRAPEFLVEGLNRLEVRFERGDKRSALVAEIADQKLAKKGLPILVESPHARGQ